MIPGCVVIVVIRYNHTSNLTNVVKALIAPVQDLFRTTRKETVNDIENFKRKILHISTHFENSLILNSNHSTTEYDLIFAYGLHSFLSSNKNSEPEPAVHFILFSPSK